MLRLASLLATCTLVACASPVPSAWIDERAAVIRCTTAGKQRMPPVLLDPFGPPAPTGLYARGLDPMALSDLGFERDAVVCATLVAPEATTVEAVRTSIAGLVEAYTVASEAVMRAAGRCACETADELELRELVAACQTRPTREGCEPGFRVEEVTAALAPLQAAIAATELPLVHWRLAGRTDREGWFADHRDLMLPRHDGGSTIFVRGQAVPRRDNDELIRGLLETDDVVSVVRQDSGTALLVVREVGRDLVLDHFAYPVVNGRHAPLLAFLDDAHLADLRQRLAAPAATRKPELDPTAGNLVELDRGLLEAVDEFIAASTPLGGAAYDVAVERRQQPTILVDRTTVQAPFGHEGERLLARIELSAAGSSWAQALSSDLLTPTLAELGPEADAPTFESGVDFDVPFVLRGTDTELVMIHGLQQVSSVMRRIEMEHPGTVRGQADAWRFEFPAADLAPEPADAPLARLREQLARKPYVLRTSFDPAREIMTVELEPR